MRRNSKDRAQTVVIGALLLFALIISFVAYVQLTQFPEINEQVELDAQDNAVNDMMLLKSTIQRVAADDFTQSTNFNSEVEYPMQPARPGEQVGQFIFKQTDGAEFENVDDNESPEVNDIEDEDTRIIVYDPSYIELSESRQVIYENGLVVERDIEELVTVPMSDQGLISDRTINILHIETRTDGLQRANPQFTVATKTEHSSFEIEPQDETEPIELTVSTEMTGVVWSEVLKDEPYVQSVNDQGGDIMIELAPETYTVNHAKVTVRA